MRPEDCVQTQRAIPTTQKSRDSVLESGMGEKFSLIFVGIFLGGYLYMLAESPWF